MELPAVLVPLEQSLTLLRPTNAVFVPNDPRVFTMGQLLRMVLEGVGKDGINDHVRLTCI
jgi:hypothetical protein